MSVGRNSALESVNINSKKVILTVLCGILLTWIITRSLKLITLRKVGGKSIVFRVRGSFSRDDLPMVLRNCLGDDYHPFITSFAPQADVKVNIATVTFDKTPDGLRSSRRTFNKENVLFDTDFHGLSVLYSPEASQHEFDIIAVCGLGGHAFGSFKERNGMHMWLRDSLPRDFENARILLYGYDTQIHGSTSFQSLESLAGALKNHVEGIQPLSPSLHETPIIFIAHSLGGLVLKQALIQSVRAGSKLSLCTRAALFFGVPNQGMHISSLIPMARGQANEAFLLNLQPESELLRSQSRLFPELLGSHKARIFCFYETRTSPTAVKGADGKWRMNGEHVIFVSSASATHCRPGENDANHVLGLDRDHSGLVKFKSGDEDYIKVRNVLRDITSNQYSLSRPKSTIPETERKLTDQCLKAMGHTNPMDTMQRIESTKDDLIAECNEWIKNDPHLKEWKNNQDHRLLWLSGDPGKGKTMLMMSLVREFRKTMGEHHFITFFFCQNTDFRLNTAHAVLCGLLWLLVRENPSLGCHLHEDYKHHQVFLSGPDGFVALCRIMTALLEDATIPTVYILIDALDECEDGREELLKFIRDNANSTHSKAKWLVSSRNHLDIERGLRMRQHGVLSLEINAAHIATAVEYFISRKVDDLAERNNYGKNLRERVQRHMMDNADSTFLWVALACKHLNDTAKRNISAELAKLPAGLSSFYDRMLDQLRDGQDRALTMAIIKYVTIAKRPLLTQELLPLLAREVPENSEEPFEDLIDNYDLLDLIKSCGSFITVRDGVIYLIHQSAKDYLVHEEGTKIFSSHMREEHSTIVDRSLAMLSKELMKDIYSHDYPRQALRSSLRRLENLDYISCYWVDHLAEYQNSCETNKRATVIRHEGKVYEFVFKYFLRWMELLCHLGQLEAAPGLLRRLEAAAERYSSEDLHLLTHDATRFLTHCYLAIEQDPLQIYNFGITFAPEESLIRKGFLGQAPTSIAISPLIGGKQWSQLQQTFDGHEAPVWSISFSPDGQQLASASQDCTVRLWDTVTGKLSWKLEGHTRGIYSVSFSHDGQHLATASQDTTVQIWNIVDGNVLWTLRGHTNRVLATVFSPDGKKLASWSDDPTPRLWDTATGKLIRTFDGHRGPIRALAFSLDGKSLVTGSKDKTIRIWNLATEEPSRVIYSHKSPVYLEIFSPHGQHIASASMSGDPTIGLWSTSTNKLLRLVGHTRPPQNFAFSPDNRQLASSAGDSEVRLWDTATGECLQIFKSHSGYSTPIAFSPDSRRLAFSSEDGVVLLRGLETGELLQTLSPEHAFSRDRIRFLAFSPDGRQLASGSDQYFTQLWDVATSRPFQVVKKHTDMISSIIFSPDGQQVMAGSEDNTIRIWDAATGESLQTLQSYKEPVRSTASSLSVSLFASASEDFSTRHWNFEMNDGSVRTFGNSVRHLDQVILSPNFQQMASRSTESRMILLRDISTGRTSQVLGGHTSRVSSIAFSPDSHYLASNSDDGTVRYWNVITGESLKTLSGHESMPNTIVFSPDGLKLASGSKNEILVWDIRTWSLIRKVKRCIERDNPLVFSPDNPLVFSPDSQKLASGFDSETARLWDITTGEVLQTFQPFDCYRSSLSFSPDGRHLTVQDNENHLGRDSRVQLFDVSTGKSSYEFESIVDGRNLVAFSPDGRLFASASHQSSYEDRAYLYDTTTNNVLRRFQGFEKLIISLAFSSDGHSLAAGSYDHRIYLWNTTTGEISAKLKGHKGHVNLLAYSPNGQQLVSGSIRSISCEYNSIWLWDLRTGEALWQIEGHSLPIRSIAFSLDQRQLASASDDTIVRLWDVQSGQLLQRLEGHTDEVHSVVFSPNGHQLASGSNDRTIRLWNTSTGQLLRRLIGHTDEVHSVVFSPNGHRLASGSSDSTVRLWDTSTGANLRTIRQNKSPVRLVSFSHDGQQLVSWSENRTVCFWNPASGEALRIFFRKSATQFWHLATNSYSHAETGFSYDEDTNWLNFNGSGLIWLPQGFRPRLSAINGNRIAVGSQSGVVYILGIDALSLMTPRQFR